MEWLRNATDDTLSKMRSILLWLQADTPYFNVICGRGGPKVFMTKFLVSWVAQKPRMWRVILTQMLESRLHGDIFQKERRWKQPVHVDNVNRPKCCHDRSNPSNPNYWILNNTFNLAIASFVQYEQIWNKFCSFMILIYQASVPPQIISL